MKKIMLMMMLAAIATVSHAQKVKVYQGNYIENFPMSNVDSITHNGSQYITVYHNEQKSTYSTDDVDSILILQEKRECHSIVQENLNGWDEGVSFTSNKEIFYVVSKTECDENNEEVKRVCINSLTNADIDKAIIFSFNTDDDLQEIVYSGYQFKIWRNADEMVFIAYDKDGVYIGSFGVPYEKVHINVSNATDAKRRSPIFNSKGELSLPKMKDFADGAGRILKSAGDVIGTAVNLEEGNYGDVLMDYLVGGIVGLADLPLAGAIIAEEGIKALLKQFYEQDKRRLIGDAEIEITSIKRTSETAITVEGTISNISSIPSKRIVASEFYPYIKEVHNTVYWGIAEGKSGQPGLYLNDNCTDLMSISNGNFSYTFYLERVPGQILYFRPFLAPEATLPSEGDWAPSPYTCIRYGERKKFVDIDVELSNFKQVKCVKEDGKYKAQFTIDGSIPGTFEDLSGWGFDVKTKSGSYWQRYDAKETDIYYPPLKKSFTCDITLEEADIIDSGIEKIAEITVTPYVSFWNSMPPQTFLDEKKYTITISNSPLRFKEIKQNSTIYSEGMVIVSMTAVIEVDSEQKDVDLSLYKSYGVYSKDIITGDEYYFSVQENESMEFNITIEIPRDYFETDYSSFTAICDNFLFETYTIDKKDKINRYDEKKPQILYNENPNIMFTSAQITGAEVIDTNKSIQGNTVVTIVTYKVSYHFEFDVIGSFWIHSLQLENEGNNWHSGWEPIYVLSDGHYELDGSIYPQGGDAIHLEKNSFAHQEFFIVNLMNGSSIRSNNCLVGEGNLLTPRFSVSGYSNGAKKRNAPNNLKPIKSATEEFDKTKSLTILKEEPILRSQKSSICVY